VSFCCWQSDTLWLVHHFRDWYSSAAETPSDTFSTVQPMNRS
jgi:hypothetical protein